MENDTVLEMRIEISPGNTKLLKVTEEDEPRDVAKKFC